MTRHHSTVSFLLGLSLLAIGGAAHAQTAVRGPRISPLKVKLTRVDQERLTRTAARHEAEILSKHTPVVDLHIAEASLNAGVRFRKTNNSYVGDHSGPTVFEIEGIDKAGGELHLVMTGGASGHVMSPHWGGQPMSVVKEYGRSDTIHLTHKGPGMTSSEKVLQIGSRGLVTQEGFTVKLDKGVHDFFYFRTSPGGGGSGGEGSEPELRTVRFNVK